MRCELPPIGWACTREAGHDGPCAAVPADSADDYVAYLRYVQRYGGTRIVLCDSDEEGAFKVYRRPQAKANETAPTEELEELAHVFHDKTDCKLEGWEYCRAFADVVIAAGWRKGGGK